jgi:hypothetical protein
VRPDVAAIPLIVVAEQPAAELVEALSTAGAFPIVESKWADAPAAFVTVKPAAIVIAEPGAPANIASARMLRIIPLVRLRAFEARLKRADRHLQVMPE